MTRFTRFSTQNAIGLGAPAEDCRPEVFASRPFSPANDAVPSSSGSFPLLPIPYREHHVLNKILFDEFFAPRPGLEILL